MTIAEIKEKLDGMSAGSKVHFYRYLISLCIFKNEKEAFCVMSEYAKRSLIFSFFVFFGAVIAAIIERFKQ